MKRFVQFIAGAICPSCKEKDTIAINVDDDEIYCVKCDFIEKRPVARNKSNVSFIGPSLIFDIAFLSMRQIFLKRIDKVFI